MFYFFVFVVGGVDFVNNLLNSVSCGCFFSGLKKGCGFMCSVLLFGLFSGD